MSDASYYVAEIDRSTGKENPTTRIAVESVADGYTFIEFLQSTEPRRRFCVIVHDDSPNTPPRCEACGRPF